MKSKFSVSWKRSAQPRKQRKYLANAPTHLKRKLLSCNLDKPLREKLKRRNIEVRKNDEVKIMRGKFSKKQGKVLVTDVNKSRLQVDGITIQKKDGEKVGVWFHASNVKIIKLEDSDKKRFKQKEEKVEKKKTEKTETKSEGKTPSPKK